MAQGLSQAALRAAGRGRDQPRGQSIPAVTSLMTPSPPFSLVAFCVTVIRVSDPLDRFSNFFFFLVTHLSYLLLLYRIFPHECVLILLLFSVSAVPFLIFKNSFAFLCYFYIVHFMFLVWCSEAVSDSFSLGRLFPSSYPGSGFSKLLFLFIRCGLFFLLEIFFSGLAICGCFLVF